MSSLPTNASTPVSTEHAPGMLKEATVLMLATILVSCVAFFFLAVALYYRFKVKRTIATAALTATALVDLGVNHVQTVILKWLHVAGVDAGSHYDAHPNEFFTRANFEVFYVDLASRRIAFRLTANPNLYLSIYRRLIDDEDREPFVPASYSASLTFLACAAPNHVAVYENAPFYYSTFGLTAIPESLQNAFHLHSTVAEGEFLRLHPQALDLVTINNV